MLLGFGSALLTQRFFVRLCKRLLGQTFLYCDCTSNAIYRTKKAPIQVLLGFDSALLTQRFFVHLCKRLFCKSFLNCNSTSDRFLRTIKGTQRVPFVLPVLFAYANNLSLLVQTDYFVKPSCTATAQATDLYAPEKALKECLLCYRCYLLTQIIYRCLCKQYYFVKPSCTATAQATEAPTIGLFPIPIRPIISTCAGTDEEPANCASECILPIVSVIP